MAVIGLSGFETQLTLQDDVSVTGTFAYSTSIKRTGLASIRFNPASGVTGNFNPQSGATAGYQHFGLYVASLPSVTRLIFNTIAASSLNVRLTSTGTLEVYNNTTLLGTSSAAFASPGWHWVAIRQVTGTNAPFLQIDGVTEVTATATVTAQNCTIGLTGTEASAADIYVDDWIADDAGLLAPSKVGLAVPISDNSNTNWRCGDSSTSNLWDAVNNLPPAGLASANETATSNIESASNTGTANYVANLTTYTTLGVAAGDTVIAVRPTIRHGEDIATGTKTGSFELTGNPVIGATVISAFGQDTGAHGAESGLWMVQLGSIANSPSVTLGNSPTMKVTKTDTTTRVACVDFMGLLVAWTPSTVTTVSGTFTANAVLKRTQTGSFTANAIIKKTIATSGSGAITGVAHVETGDGAATTTHQVAAPAGFASGQYVVVELAWNGSPGTITVPGGFNLIGSAVGQSNPKIHVYGGFWADVGGGPWTWITTGNLYAGWVGRSYTGVDTTTPLDVAGVGTDGVAAVTFDLTGITTVTANAMVGASAAANSSADRITEDNDLVEVARAFGTNIKTNMMVEGIQAAAGATGVKNFDLNSSVAWAGVVWALRPAPGGGGLTLDAFLARTVSGSFTANAVLKRTQTGSFTANAVIKRTIAYSAAAVVYSEVIPFASATSVNVTVPSLAQEHLSDAVYASIRFTADAGALTPPAGWDIWDAEADNAAAYSLLTQTGTGLPSSGTFSWTNAVSGTVLLVVVRNVRAPFLAGGAGQHALVTTSDGGLASTSVSTSRAPLFHLLLSAAAGNVAFSGLDGGSSQDWADSRATVSQWVGHKSALTSPNAAIPSFTLTWTPSSTGIKDRADLPVAYTIALYAVLKKVGIAGSFTANAIVRTTPSATFTANAVLKRSGIAASFTLDAVIKRSNQSGSFTANAIIRKTQSGSFTADAVMATSVVTQSGSFTANAIVRRTTSATLTADAVIKRTQTAALTADAVVKRSGVAGSLTANAVIRRTSSSALTADAIVKRTISASFTADAVVKRTISATFAEDAILRRTTSASFTANAIVKRTTSATLVADAVVKRTISATLVADAIVRRTTTASLTANAVIKAAVVGSFTANAVLKRTIASTFTADAVVKKTASALFTADALIVRTTSGSFTANAIVKRTTSATLTADAVVKRTLAGTFTEDAVLRRTTSATLTADAVVRRTTSSTLTADAVVKRTISGSFTANAIIRRASSATLTADAVVKRTQAASLTADAVLKRTGVASFTADAIVRRGGSAALAADAIIRRTSSATLTADAIVRRGQAASFTIDARVVSVGRAVWTTPGNSIQIPSSPTLAFTIPTAQRPLHFEIQIDEDSNFGSPLIFLSHRNQTGWEYWDGGAWQPVPQSGVPASFVGNEARYTLQTPLANGTWYRRVRAGVI